MLDRVEPIVRSKRLTSAELGELVNFFHVARTALAGQRDDRGDRADSRHGRMLWAAREFSKGGRVTEMSAYLELSAALESGSYRGSDWR